MGLPGPRSNLLSVSIVTYRPDMRLLLRTVASLERALAIVQAGRAGTPPTVLDLIDNDGGLQLNAVMPSQNVDAAQPPTLTVHIIGGQGNVGYGRGHNLAITNGIGQYHLILNPDVDVAPDALDIALRFMDAHLEVGLLAPRVVGDDGRLQYLCRRYPTVLDLLVRGFLPRSLRAVFAARLACYEMREQIDQVESEKKNGVESQHAVSGYLSPPLISGCFMLFRADVLKKLGGFDPRYFLYFEDYDLSLRAGEITKIAYHPAVRITHFGGGASRKGWQHIKLFASSAYKFFNRFGWRWA